MISTIQIITTFAAVEEESGGLGALGLDPLALLAQATTFLVLFWLVKKFALDKIVNSLEERRQTIDKGVRLGIEMQDEKDKLDQKVEKTLHNARTQADAVLANANKEAGAIVKQAEEHANLRVETMIEDAHARIEDDIQKARRQLESEMAKLLAKATQVIIQEKLDVTKDSALIRRALEEAKR